MAQPVLTGSKPSLADRAALELESRLVTLHYPPGALLQEKSLAIELGLGRTPVREAVLQIARGGLIRIMPRKGLLVAPISREELQQVLETRRVLERLLVVKAAERASADQRRDLGELARSMGSVERDVDAFFRLDRQLDLVMEEACRNPYLVSALGPLHSHCRRLWYLAGGRLDLEAAVELHVSLAETVAAQDASGAIRSVNGIIAILDRQLGALDVIS